LMRSALIVSKTLGMIASEIKEESLPIPWQTRNIYSWSWRSAQFLGIMAFPNSFAWVKLTKWAKRRETA
jgi:hypothetical protein